MAHTKFEKSVSEDFVTEGGKLVVAFFRNTEKANVGGQSVRVGSFDLAFFEVQGFNRVNYRDLDLRDSTGSLVSDISAGSGSDFQRIHDSSGNDIFRVETNENPWQITQASVSVVQDDVWVYPRIPETESHPGWTWAVGDEPDPTEGDQFGMVAGTEMNYEDPPASLQGIAFESGDRSTIQYGFYNNSQQRQVQPRLNVEGRTYRTVPVVDGAKQEQILQDALGDEQDARILTFGPVTDSYTINFPDEWDSIGNTVKHIGSLRDMEVQG